MKKFIKLGKKIMAPTFNFITGHKEYNKEIQMGENDILVVEEQECKIPSSLRLGAAALPSSFEFILLALFSFSFLYYLLLLIKFYLYLKNSQQFLMLRLQVHLYYFLNQV